MIECMHASLLDKEGGGGSRQEKLSPTVIVSTDAGGRGELCLERMVIADSVLPGVDRLTRHLSA